MSPRQQEQQELDGMPQAPAVANYAGYPVEEMRLGIIGLNSLAMEQRLEPGDGCAGTRTAPFFMTTELHHCHLSTGHPQTEGRCAQANRSASPL